jgi:phosphogluconate dehydratase
LEVIHLTIGIAMASTTLHPTLIEVTQRVIARSAPRRTAYLESLAEAASRDPRRGRLSCANLAHVFAAAGADKGALRGGTWPNLAIVTAYNDMLSAHQPFERFPAIIKAAARTAGATAQVAGGVPAMCDGVTQGRPGMEASLLSRDVIAMSTAVALTHDAFDAALYLGVCDKIVPGLLMAALTFGHLPAVFVPAGPMSSGLPNKDKARIRREFAEGKVGREALLEAESQSYHAAGTCTFYGTANSNQMLMEVMGLHVPGAAFVSPGTPLRDALTAYAAERAAAATALGPQYNPVGRMIDERSIVNAMVALLATGGSTNHTIHLVAIAAAAGIEINWDDFDALSEVVPLIARVYPNGSADVNHFHAAGGSGFVIRSLLATGFLHQDVGTVMGRGLDHYAREPFLMDGCLEWRDSPEHSLDTQVLRPASDPFDREGGIRVLRGNLGRCVIKTSAMKREDFFIEAPARVFDCQAGLVAAFNAGALEGNFVAVVRGQGPRANGMPELHQLTTVLGSLMAQGQKVALLTDGRMSGASGPVPAAIHLTPEAARGGPIGRIRDGNIIRLDVEARTLNVLVDPKDFESRDVVSSGVPSPPGYGLELFRTLRATIKSAEEGALSCL